MTRKEMAERRERIAKMWIYGVHPSEIASSLKMSEKGVVNCARYKIGLPKQSDIQRDPKIKARAVESVEAPAPVVKTPAPPPTILESFAAHRSRQRAERDAGLRRFG